MSIEQDLTRIANATEQILAVLVSQSNAVVSAKPVAAAPITTVAPVEYTEDQVRTAVRDYMNKTDKDKAIALLVKYGAKKEKPMIKDVTDVAGLMRDIVNG